MTRSLPAAAAEVTWTRAVDVSDKELAELVRVDESGRRFADKLLKVWVVDGSEQGSLSHIEVQG